MAGAGSSRERAASALAGVIVAVTRPAQGDALGAALEAEGARVERVPLIRIEPAVDEAALAAVVAKGAWDWIVFTSANAVAVLAARVGPGRIETRRVAAVGTATAIAAEAAGYPVDVVPDEHRAEGLVAALAARGSLDGVRVLWPRAAGARPVLRDALATAGADVHEIALYRTIEDREAGRALGERVRSGEVDVVTFTSPSAVRAWAAGSAAPRDAGIVAVIGPVTAAAAQEAGLRVDVVAPTQSASAMVAALRAFFDGRARRAERSEEGQ